MHALCHDLLLVNWSLQGSQGAGGRSRGIAVLGGGIRPPPRRNRLQWCQALRFLEKPGPVVALASFPGSGNTWVRYLLQQVTGEYHRNVVQLTTVVCSLPDLLWNYNAL
jgi:hypothetical protein